VTSHIGRRCAAALLGALVLADCSGDVPAKSANTRAAVRKTGDSASGTVDLSTGSYKAAPLAAMGTLAGTVTVQGGAAVDSIAVEKQGEVCASRNRRNVTPTKPAGETVVWIADVKTGKSLPIEKRAELSSIDCVLEPPVQAVVVGTTVNVFNDDRSIHRLAFFRIGTHDTVMPFFNLGQVVASERLAKQPGIVEVRCKQHLWTRGYIAVFDHPYFAVAEDDGSFKIDSLPPGNYRVMAWHPGLTKPVEQRVQVAANGTAKLTFSLTLATAR